MEPASITITEIVSSDAFESLVTSVGTNLQAIIAAVLGLAAGLYLLVVGWKYFRKLGR